LRIEAYGTVDELNSYIGLCKDLIEDNHSRTILREVQDRLFTIGSSLASDPAKEPKLKIPDLKEEDIVLLEKEIDGMNAQLPPMKNFILPGGHPTVSHIHIARCVCRRAERCCVRLELEKEEIEPIVIKYLNRLSDYLFMLARFAAHQLKTEEIPWKARL
jgi:cob(I)alamin adenosyltransferase